MTIGHYCCEMERCLKLEIGSIGNRGYNKMNSLVGGVGKEAEGVSLSLYCAFNFLDWRLGLRHASTPTASWGVT